MLKQVDAKEVRKIIEKFEFDKVLWLIREEIKKVLVNEGVNENKVNEIKKVNFEVFHDGPGDFYLDGVHFLDDNDRHFDLSSFFSGEEAIKKAHKLKKSIDTVVNEGVVSRIVHDDGVFYNFNVIEQPKCPIFFVEND